MPVEEELPNDAPESPPDPNSDQQSEVDVQLEQNQHIDDQNPQETATNRVLDDQGASRIDARTRPREQPSFTIHDDQPVEVLALAEILDEVFKANNKDAQPKRSKKRKKPGHELTAQNLASLDVSFAQRPKEGDLEVDDARGQWSFKTVLANAAHEGNTNAEDIRRDSRDIVAM